MAIIFDKTFLLFFKLVYGFILVFVLFLFFKVVNISKQFMLNFFIDLI